MKTIILLIAFFTLTLAGQQSRADSIYTLDYDSCSGGCGNGSGTSNNSFGTVTLSQISSNSVTVSLQITNPGYIVNTGNGSNHAPFAFNTDTSVSISNITPSTYFTVGATNASVSGLGTFGYEIACTGSCSSGASHGGEGTSLSFTVTATTGGLSLNDFVANSSGFYFASDIIGPSGNTGEVAGNQAPALTSAVTSVTTPEPASLAIMAVGLAALGGLRRRRVPA
jgi:hypothetical protein